jgi:hypothetical protein
MEKQILTVTVTDITTNKSYSEKCKPYIPSTMAEQISTSRSRIIKAYNLCPNNCVVTHVIEQEQKL